jgi:hypothetical protein
MSMELRARNLFHLSILILLLSSKQDRAVVLNSGLKVLKTMMKRSTKH